MKVLTANRGKVKDASPRKEGNVESRRHESDGRGFKSRWGQSIFAKFLVKCCCVVFFLWNLFIERKSCVMFELSCLRQMHPKLESSQAVSHTSSMLALNS